MGWDGLHQQSDGLDLSRDAAHIAAPQVDAELLRLADAIFDNEQADIVDRANAKAKRRDVQYVNDFGWAQWFPGANRGRY